MGPCGSCRRLVLSCVGLLCLVGSVEEADAQRRGHRARPSDRDTYLVGGIGYLTVTGDHPVASFRDPGWDFYLGARRRIGERLLLGLSGELGLSNLDERALLNDHEVFVAEPERFVQRGSVNLIGGTFGVIWEYPVDKSTVVYAKGGASFFSWSHDPIFIDTEALGVEDRVPSLIEIPSGEAFGGHVGGGLRFPMGENAGVFAEFEVHVLFPDGGSMNLAPFRVGVSIP